MLTLRLLLHELSVPENIGHHIIVLLLQTRTTGRRLLDALVGNTRLSDI